MTKRPNLMPLPAANANMVEWALYYAGLGCKVFPLKPKTKNEYYADYEHLGAPSKKYPHGTPYSWQAQATDDEQRIKAAWTEHPDANIGIATGNGLYVLDGDVRENGAWTDSIEKWKEKDILPGDLNLMTWTSLTGSGGTQLFYFLPPELVEKAKKHKIDLAGDAGMVEDDSHIDSRGDGRYIVAPPSLHPNGNTYMWDEKKNPSTIPIADFDKTIEFLFVTKGKKKRKRNGHVNAEPGNLIPYGSRRKHMVQRAGELVDKMADFASDSAIVAALMDIAHTELDLSVPLDSGEDGLRADLYKMVYDFRLSLKKEREDEEQTDWTYCMRAWYMEHPGQKPPDSIDWEEVKAAGNRRKNNELTVIEPEKPPDEKKDQADISELAKYHRWSKPDSNGKKFPKDIIDVLICEHIQTEHKIMVMEGQPYIYQGGVYKLDPDGLKIKQLIQEHIYQDLIKSARIEQCFKLLVSDPKLHHDLGEVNKHPKEWVNCINGMLDAKSMKLYQHSPDYMSVNQIPLEYIPGEIDKDGISYQFIESLIPDEDDREMFLQFCGLCLTKDTSPQKSLYMIGGGGTGKSTTINMVCNVIGADNISGLSLQDINKRFYPTCLAGKLMNACADIPSAKMDTVDIIKKIIGEDVIMGEYKGGKTFFFRSYAKLMFSANKLPKVYDDKTDAYYRRLMILEIRKKAKHFDDLEVRLYEDRQNFFRMILEALNRMYAAGGLFESENSKRLVHDLYVDSDTVFAFLESETKKTESSFSISRKRVYEAYSDFCEAEGRTALTAHKFREELENRGYTFCKINGYDYIKGLEFI